MIIQLILAILASLLKIMIKKTFVIAEMACSHDGSIKNAKTIIANAYKAGADAIQLQIWSLGDMISPKSPLYKKVESIAFSEKQWKNIVDFTKNNYPNLKIYVCLYEHKSINFIKRLKIHGFKINSADLSNPLVLIAAAKTNKPINLSVGASNLKEITSALNLIKKNSRAKVTLMYGFQNFPTKYTDVNLAKIKILKNKFKSYDIGYQDHTSPNTNDPFFLVSNAIGMGCKVIEHHLTYRLNAKGFDHESALDIFGFKRLVQMIKMLEVTFGSENINKMNTSELNYRKFQKKSLVYATNLKKGSVISQNEIIPLRVNKEGINPSDSYRIIGKKLKYNKKKYQQVNSKDFI
jgi:sialic acid synthase SpsE